MSPYLLNFTAGAGDAGSGPDPHRACTLSTEQKTLSNPTQHDHSLAGLVPFSSIVCVALIRTCNVVVMRHA